MSSSAPGPSTTLTSNDLNPQHLEILAQFSPCDISDALLAIDPSLPQSGFLVDITPLTSSPTTTSTTTNTRIVAPASTLKLIPKSPSASSTVPDPLPQGHPSAIPKDAHWVDLTPPHHIVLIESAPNSYAASIGGIMALRMSLNNVRACLISGRARDLSELNATGLPIWTGQGLSSVATGAEAKVWGRECEIEIGGMKVQPGDVVCLDQGEGVTVVVPRGLVGKVVEVVGGLVERDEKVVEAVRGGMSVKEAFGKFRGKDTRA
jgi:regulator of RNase E activity RraA